MRLHFKNDQKGVIITFHADTHEEGVHLKEAVLASMVDENTVGSPAAILVALDKFGYGVELDRQLEAWERKFTQ